MDGFFPFFFLNVLFFSYKEAFSTREFHVFEQPLPELEFDMYMKSERYF